MADERDEGKATTPQKPAPGETEATRIKPGPGEPGDARPGDAATPPGPGEITARLDGIRGWLGDLDRTVRIRSRIGLVLAAIAIGAAGAAIYLSLDAKEQSASDRDVSSLRDQLQQVQQQSSETAQDVTSLKSSVDSARRQAADASSTVGSLRAQIKSLRTDVADLQQSVSEAAAAPAPSSDTGAADSSPGTPPAGSDEPTGGAGNP
jgi:cell division protein FtsB